jgi:hypothetical protein
MNHVAADIAGTAGNQDRHDMGSSRSCVSNIAILTGMKIRLATASACA